MQSRSLILDYAPLVLLENFADRSTPNPSGTIDALAMQGYLALVRAREAPKTVLGEASQYQRLEVGLIHADSCRMGRVRPS